MTVLAPRTAAVAMTASELHAWLASTDRVKTAPAPNGSSLPYVLVPGSPARGFLAVDEVDHGFLKTDQELVIVPLASGGSAGNVDALLFTRVNGARRFIGYLPGPDGQLEAFIKRGELNVVMPIYTSSDPNCCPSQHRYQTYALSGITLRKRTDYVAR